MAKMPRRVYIDSFSHYQFQRQADSTYVLLEFGDGHDCPKMGDRGDYTPGEGVIIEHFAEGEEVEFIYSSYISKVGERLLEPHHPGQDGSPILCGDDLIYSLRKTAIPE